MPTQSKPSTSFMSRDIAVLCVDDNAHVADAVRIKLSRAGGFSWQGWASDAETLLQMTRHLDAAVVILDLDMPGLDPFETMVAMQNLSPEIRVVVFSGHVRRELIDKAVTAGAWGYVAKSDGENALVDALRRVAAGEFAMSPEVRAVFDL